MAEEWRPIPDWEDLYAVSSEGRVWSYGRYLPHNKGGFAYHPPRILKSTPVPSGHRVVSLRRTPIHFRPYVHWLVATAFLPNPEGHKLVLHWDDDPSNNRVENLRWGTYGDNALDRVRNGKDANALKTHCSRGHEYNEENTRVSNGSRVCRPCDAQRARKYRRMRSDAD